MKRHKSILSYLLAIATLFTCTLAITPVPAFASSASLSSKVAETQSIDSSTISDNPQVSIENGTLVITVNSEDEAELVCQALEESSQDAIATYNRAVLTGQSQNPNNQLYITNAVSSLSDTASTKSNSSLSNSSFSQTSDAKKKFWVSTVKYTLCCYCVYQKEVSGGVARFGKVYKRCLYIQNADYNILDKTFSACKKLDSARTIAFNYSCTIKVNYTDLSGNSATRTGKASAYCEFYASGGAYCK